MAQGGSADWMDFVSIPASIILGVVLGAMAGYLLSLLFETAYARKHYVRNSMKVIIVLGVSFLLMAIETWLEGIVPVSGLLAVVSMACVIKIKRVPSVSGRLSEKFGKLCFVSLHIFRKRQCRRQSALFRWRWVCPAGSSFFP